MCVRFNASLVHPSVRLHRSSCRHACWSRVSSPSFSTKGGSVRGTGTRGDRRATASVLVRRRLVRPSRCDRSSSPSPSVRPSLPLPGPERPSGTEESVNSPGAPKNRAFERGSEETLTEENPSTFLVLFRSFDPGSFHFIHEILAQMRRGRSREMYGIPPVSFDSMWSRVRIRRW